MKSAPPSGTWQDSRRDENRPSGRSVPRRFRLHIVLLVMVTVLMGAAARMQTPEWRTYPIAEAPRDLRPAIQHGDLIIISLQSALLSELRRELGRGGPSRAIQSCHLDATAAAYRAAREEGIAAGRTSDRLRSPLNAPRPWAAPIVQRYAGQKAAGVDGFAVDLGDRVGVMRPIPHRATCSGCHGRADKFSQAVKADLKDRYPADRATGFSEGEVRGWFWVEVPRKR